MNPEELGTMLYGKGSGAAGLLPAILFSGVVLFSGVGPKRHNGHCIG